MSRGFMSALFGLAMTFFAWYAPWAWPAWPSILAFDTFDHGGFAELSHTGQSVVTVLLIALNVVVWALIARAVWWLGGRLRRGERTSSSALTRR